jgi:hypothetical protein
MQKRFFLKGVAFLILVLVLLAPSYGTTQSTSRILGNAQTQVATQQSIVLHPFGPQHDDLFGYNF